MNRFRASLTTICFIWCASQGHAEFAPTKTRAPMFLGFSTKQFELRQVLGYVCVGQKSSSCPGNYQVFYDCNWAKGKKDKKEMQSSMGTEICIQRLHADDHSSVVVKTT